MTKHRKLPVTQRALIQRVNRVLAKTGPGHWYSEQVHINPAEPRPGGLGVFYLINSGSGFVTPDVDLEALGRELEVLRPWEQLEEAV